MNFKNELGIKNLRGFLGVESLNKELNVKQKKAINNIKGCANDQWGFVNSWYDEKDKDARAFMLDPDELFDVIYQESIRNVYSDAGGCWFGANAKAYIKDIRFCGKKFLEKVVFYFTVDLMDDAFGEVEGTKEDADRILESLKAMKEKVAA